MRPAQSLATELYALYVAPAHWSTGAGRALMGRVLAEAQAEGYPRIVLWVLEQNARARRFYERAGFRLRGRTHQLDWLGGIPEVCYIRDLGPAPGYRGLLDARWNGRIYTTDTSEDFVRHGDRPVPPRYGLRGRDAVRRQQRARDVPGAARIPVELPRRTEHVHRPHQRGRPARPRA